jgi:hypothetical protein
MKKNLPFFLLLFVLKVTAQNCPPEGDATDTKRQQTNILKNRDRAPVISDFDSAITIWGMLNSQDESNAFNQNTSITITGYLLKAKDEGPESCNCHSTNKADHDVHIYIAPNKDVTSIGECVVVEITPWVKKNHPEWTSRYLNSIAEHKVSVTGWLFWDWEHTNVSKASHSDNPKRGTVWEIHPIINIVDLGTQ